ncbi:MAG: helix-turn-helix domain-containing protein [Oscillospiraceae bacterium]|nr:helix-turn-helix domain-containing protein [Oscillospiraceae bacterium]
MNTYITAQAIRQLREARTLTQAQLAEKIGVSDKAVSKWETSRGLPDISLIEPLAQALGVSVVELMNGQRIVNRNTTANVLRTKLHVCPICGNIHFSMGDALISCCGISLPALGPEVPDEAHKIQIIPVENEHLISVEHSMTKDHYISFIAFVSSDRVQFKKLYPEGPAEARMQLRGHGTLYAFCNRHSLFSQRI